MYEMPTMQVWQRLWDEGKLVGATRAFFEQKASEELYDTWSDPHEVRNLAAAPELRPVLARLRAELDRWMLEIHDTGLLPEAEMLARAEGSTIYEMARDPAKYDQRRIMEAAALASARNPKNLGRLTGLLGDRDSAVRYWAATGLVILGRAAASAAPALMKALGDAAPNVRIAAAEALCTIAPARASGDRCAQALGVLGAALGHSADEVRLHAAGVIDLLAPSPNALAAIAANIRDAAAKAPAASYSARALPRLVARLQRAD
jgi:hypothetical protein